MNKVKNFLRTLIYRISYEYKNKKDLSNFIQKKQKYLSMTNDEFLIKYIDISSKYEQKKMMLSILSITLVISILLGLWRDTFRFISKVHLFEYTDIIESELRMGVIDIALILLLIMFAIGFYAIYCFIKQYINITKEKYFIETIKTLR